jgi:hypothetical protein
MDCLFDQEEAEKVREYSKKYPIYTFNGWSFPVIWTLEYSEMLCFKACYKNGIKGLTYKILRDRCGEEYRKAAAWFIAHWWEHKLEICPCLGTHQDSNFMDTVIASQLYYAEHLGLEGTFSYEGYRVTC